jgi:hypothetical protein
MAWTKPNKAEAAPHVTSLSQRFNTISLWLADLVVESYGRAAHTAVVEKIVEVLKVSNFLLSRSLSLSLPLMAVTPRRSCSS